MINSFKNFLVEEEKTVFFTFGRMNPPTIGHGMLLDKLSSKAGSNPYRVFLSQSQDAKKNPLDYASKVKFARKMFPRHARSIMLNKKIKTVFDALVTLYNEGYKNIVMVVGSDRVTEFETLITNYNGKDGRHGHYNFKRINVVSAGERDPDSDDVSGASATKQRQAAADNDFTTFSQGLPKRVSTADAKALFNSVRKGLGLKEEKNFKRHIELAPVSDLREAFVNNKLFEIGEKVVLPKQNSAIGTIKHLGANYVIVESKSEKYRCWIDDVLKLDPNETVAIQQFEVGATPERGVIREQKDHRLNPKLSFKHQLKHATKQYIDVDGDGDVDAADKMAQAKEFGDVSGVPDITKYLKKRQGIEKKHTKIGVAYESKNKDRSK